MKNLLDNLLTEDEVTLLTALGEYQPIAEAMALSDTVDLLPSDIDAFMKKLRSVLTDNYDKNVKKLEWIEKHDPEFFTQIIAFYEVMNNVDEETAKVEKLDIESLKKQERKEIIDHVLKIIMGND